MSYNQYQAVFFACRSMLAKNRPRNEARLRPAPSSLMLTPFNVPLNSIYEQDDHYQSGAKKWSGFGLTNRTGSAGPRSCTTYIPDRN